MIASTSPAVSVVVVSDSQWFGESLARRLKDDPRIAGAQAVVALDEWLADRVEAAGEVLLVDAGALGDEACTVCEAARSVPGLCLVAFGVEEGDPLAVRLVEAGAMGLVPPAASLGRLVDAVVDARRGRATCPPATLASVMDRLRGLAAAALTPAMPQCLSNRQAEVARMAAAGMTNKQIARRLGIRPATARNHVHEILRRRRLGRRYEIAAEMRNTEAMWEESMLQVDAYARS